MANSLRVIFGIFGVILFLMETVPAAAGFKIKTNAQLEAEYKKAVEADPNNAEAHYKLGSITSSIDELTRAIELKPDYWPAYLARGDAYDRDGQLDKAIQDFTIVITQTPNEPKAYIARAQVYKKQPFRSLWAIWDVDKAIEIDKNYFGAYDLRAEIKKKSWLPWQAWYLLGIKDAVEEKTPGQRITDLEQTKAFEEAIKASRSLGKPLSLEMKQETFEEMIINKMSRPREKQPSPLLGLKEYGPVEEMTTEQVIKAFKEMSKFPREETPSQLVVGPLDNLEKGHMDQAAPK